MGGRWAVLAKNLEEWGATVLPISIFFSRWRLVLALSLSFGREFAMNYSVFTAMLSSTPLETSTVERFWFISLVTCTLTLAAFVLSRRLRRWASGTAVIVAALTMALGLGLVGLAVLTMESSSLLCCAGALFSGFGTAIMIALWGRHCLHGDSGITLQLIAVATLLGSLAALILLQLPFVLDVLILMGFSLGYGGLFRRVLNNKGDGCTASASQCFEPPARYSSVSSGIKQNAGIVQSVAIKTLRVSVFMGLVAVMGIADAGMQSVQGAIIFVAVSLCSAVGLLISKSTGGTTGLSLVYLPVSLVAIAFAMAAYVAPWAPEWTTVVLAIYTLGAVYFYGLLWAYCAEYVRYDARESRVFVGGFFCGMMGRMVGYIGGGWLQLVFGYQTSLVPVSNAVVYLLLLSVIALLASWGSKMKSRSATMSDIAIEEACHLAAKRFDLTLRESEVLLYLVKGCERSFIARSLVVSPETVKTHMQHIYSKLGVHTRFEVINTVIGCLER